MEASQQVQESLSAPLCHAAAARHSRYLAVACDIPDAQATGVNAGIKYLDRGILTVFQVLG